jgi:hypothetical protein
VGLLGEVESISNLRICGLNPKALLIRLSHGGGHICFKAYLVLS